MLTSKAIDSFMVLQKETGEVLLQTPILTYFVRATMDGFEQSEGDVQYIVKCHDGEMINITGQFMDYHPMLADSLDPELRAIAITISGGVLIDVHPDQRPVGDRWIQDELLRRDFEGDVINLTLIDLNAMGIDLNRDPSLNHTKD